MGVESGSGFNPDELAEKYKEMVKSGQAKNAFEARDTSTREENLVEWGKQAETINKNRAIWQKIVGRDKVTPLDMAQNEAEKIDQYLSDLLETKQAQNYQEAFEIFRRDPNFFHAKGEEINEEQLAEIQTRIEEEERQQKEFEKKTKEAMEKFRSLNPSERFDVSKDLPINYEVFDDTHHNKHCVPGVMCEFLFEINQKDGYPDSFSVLEIGSGFNSAEGMFFQEKAHYTGLDVNMGVPPEDELGVGYKAKNGKLEEELLMDVIDIPKYLNGRTYDYIFGLSVFGWPTEWSAKDYYKKQYELENIDVTDERVGRYEKQMLRAMSSVLRDGGLMLFSTREMMFHFESEELKEMGFDYQWKWIDGSPYMLIRKIPKGEVVEKEKE